MLHWKALIGDPECTVKSFKQLGELCCAVDTRSRPAYSTEWQLVPVTVYNAQCCPIGLSTGGDAAGTFVVLRWSVIAPGAGCAVRVHPVEI